MSSEQTQSISILGATGSIGESALSVLQKHSDKFNVFALGANANFKKLFEMCQIHQPKFAVMADADAATQLQDLITHSSVNTEVLAGAAALDQMAKHTEVDVVVAAIVGAAGLSSTMAAARAGKKILLANKESIVIAGNYLLQAVKDNKAELIPLDSEHNAIFQCHPVAQAKVKIGETDNSVKKILLTASGGPFLERDINTFETITVAEACKHPRWSMGRKISVDSATMMNKGLEFIEASYLFGLSADNIQIVVHPQSIVHSMVEYIDGSVLAQLGSADMRIPIAHALGFPERLESGAESLDIFSIARFDFKLPCIQRFPALKLAQWAAEEKQVLPTILNAANEVCVAAFLDEKINFVQISSIVEKVMSDLHKENVNSLADIMELDSQTRVATTALLKH